MFQPILENLVVQAGAHWAMIVGTDGMVLETDSPSFRSEAEGLAPEYAACYRAARLAADGTDAGFMRHAIVAADKGKILFHFLTDDYFLVALLPSDAHAGKTCFEIARVTNPLAKELSC